jgi:imidazoleglycerol-phosphate dehydratase
MGSTLYQGDVVHAIELSRKTKETDITLRLDLYSVEPISIETGVPFFTHMLTSMAFHGRFSLGVTATGDIDVDPHHLVEDVGLVLGDAFRTHLHSEGQVARFGHSIVPMDDALSEAVVDVCERPYLVFAAQFPQSTVGTFPVAMVREFLQAFSVRAAVNLHARCRYGENSHHMIESLFKALGRAISTAYAPRGGDGMSTKGTL